MRRNWHANQVGIQLQVSSYKKFKLATPRDYAPITREIGVRRTNQDRKFRHKYDYNGY